ncbi:uncharacterized protein LOC117555811 [Gymnodraco acuticeps]|uniref:Uncharacterized protein LOC117555811 n=1 Tax=Gymnodraco acuticeps TaxID=8218 RepID=A0A6P8WGZ8_GYMAC|nr:uncharacterized protein LOC117555811 [Gymnodraco acuticeps]
MLDTGNILQFTSLKFQQENLTIGECKDELMAAIGQLTLLLDSEGILVHPRTEPPPSHWIPRREASERQKEDEKTGQVIEHAADTTTKAKSFRENGWDIQGIRQEFPHLFTPGMIAQDFQILHGEAAPKLFETWLPLFKDKILHLARREGKLISSLDGLTPDCLGELALSQLPTLLPPTVYRVGRKVFRYTIEESKLAFIDHKPVGTNLVDTP